MNLYGGRRTLFVTAFDCQVRNGTALFCQTSSSFCAPNRWPDNHCRADWCVAQILNWCDRARRRNSRAVSNRILFNLRPYGWYTVKLSLTLPRLAWFGSDSSDGYHLSTVNREYANAAGAAYAPRRQSFHNPVCRWRSVLRTPFAATNPQPR